MAEDQNQGEALAQRVAPQVARARLDTPRQARRVDVPLRDGKHGWQVEHRGMELFMGLGEGDGVSRGAAAHVQQAFVRRGPDRLHH